MTTAHTPSRNCYLRGCRDAACVRVSTRYSKQLRIEHQRGHYRMTDATQTRHHIERLTAAGWTQRQIAHASGVEAASIHQIYVGAQARTANWRAARILAISIAPPPHDNRRVDITGSRRRLQALRVMGHRRYDLAAQLNITPDRVKHITSGHTRWVTPDEAATIARLYRRLAMVPGPSQQTATLARKQGWHGPLAWEDIDNPDCKPETDGRPEFQRRRKTSVDPGRVARLTLLGRTNEQIAAELGCHERTVSRVRRRAEMQQAA